MSQPEVTCNFWAIAAVCVLGNEVLEVGEDSSRGRGAAPLQASYVRRLCNPPVQSRAWVEKGTVF